MDQHMDGSSDNEVNMSQAWTRFLNLLELIRHRLQLQEKAAQLQEYALSHPTQALFIAMVFSMCSIPIGCFIVFSCITVIITLIGFICFEGILLFIGAIVLTISVVIFAIIAVIFSVIILGVASTYTGGRHAYLYVNGGTLNEHLQRMYIYCMQRAEQWMSSHQNARNSPYARVETVPHED